MKTNQLSLYILTLCPYCVKVRAGFKALGINIETRNIAKSQHKKDLIAGGGKRQVPCLRIKNSDGEVEWLYESDDILAFVQNNLAV